MSLQVEDVCDIREVPIVHDLMVSARIHNVKLSPNCSEVNPSSKRGDRVREKLPLVLLRVAEQNEKIGRREITGK